MACYVEISIIILLCEKFNHNMSAPYNISRHGVHGGNGGEHIFDVTIVTVMHLDFALPGSLDFLRRAAHAQALQGQPRLHAPRACAESS
jgi:hypothetical protein